MPNIANTAATAGSAQEAKAGAGMPVVNQLKELIVKNQTQIETLLPAHYSVHKFLRTIFTQFHKNKALAECSHESILASVLTAAEMGLTPDGREGALVPYNNKGVKEAQFLPMYQGLIKLARNTGTIADIFPATICVNDDFSYGLGSKPFMDHRPAFRNRGEPIAFYAMILNKDGTSTFGPGPMLLEEIKAIQKRSKSGGNGPWITDFESMAWKTVIRRVLKYVTQSSEQLDKALTLEGEFVSSISRIDNQSREVPVDSINSAIKEQADKREKQLR